MTVEEIVQHLEQRLDLLQRRIVELTSQRDEIERQIKNYRDLIRYYRAVWEAEKGVGLQKELPPEVIRAIEEDMGALKETEQGEKKAQTISWAVKQILAQVGRPMRLEAIERAILEQYPDIAKKSKNLYHSIEAQCLRARQEGIMRKVAPRCYAVMKKDETQ